MFTSLILSKYSSSSPPSELSLSYHDLSCMSLLPASFHSILKLTLSHCQLSSLTHIDQFPHLEHLSIKFNSIGSLEELLKIKNKHLIKSLNFKGNDIEHLQAARIEQLRVHFPNIVELNDRDFRFQEVSRMSWKKEVETVRILHRLDTMGAMLDSIHHSVDKDPIKDPHSYRESHKENIKPEVFTHRQAKSFKEEELTHKKKELQISTSHIEHVHSHIGQQPTATFAVTRAKELEHRTSFMFKKDITISRVQNKSECSFEQSFMRYQSNETSDLFPDVTKNLNRNKEQLVEAIYSQNLLKKAFGKWSLLQESSRNMPRKKEF